MNKIQKLERTAKELLAKADEIQKQIKDLKGEVGFKPFEAEVGDRYFTIHMDEEIYDSGYIQSGADYDIEASGNFLQFETKEERDEFLLFLKACLKARQVLKFVNQGWAYDLERDRYRNQCQLEFTDNKFSVEYYTQVQSPILFKDKEAGEKFLEIMGDQVKDLFKFGAF